jgi:hypothetical protein
MRLGFINTKRRKFLTEVGLLVIQKEKHKEKAKLS